LYTAHEKHCHSAIHLSVTNRLQRRQEFRLVRNCDYKYYYCYCHYQYY